MAVPVLAVIGLASAAYSIWESHQQTSAQREASRGRHRAMFWGGLAGAFAAGTPLVAGMGKVGGYAGSSGAGAGTGAATTEAAVETTAATGGTAGAAAGTEPIVTTGAGEVAAAQGAGATASTEYTVGMNAAGGSGAPAKVKLATWSARVQGGLKGKTGNMAMQLSQQALAPQQQEPMATPPQQRRQVSFTDFYEDEESKMSMSEAILTEENRGSLRSTWWEA